jgi:hypothetical protein
MYLIEKGRPEQINMNYNLDYKSSNDLLVHWLNPILYKCKKRSNPDDN